MPRKRLISKTQNRPPPAKPEVEVLSDAQTKLPAPKYRRYDCRYSVATIGKILEGVAETGSLAKSAKAAGVSPSGAYKKKATDEQFAQLVEEAMTLYCDSLEAEIDCRAFTGVDKPVFYQGKRVDTVKEYSDLLAMFRMKKLDPSYREKSDINVGIAVGITLNED